MMEDFIERTLRERRSLPDALADMLAKHDRTPSGSERSTLERMIEVMKDEIAFRQNSVSFKVETWVQQTHQKSAQGSV